MTICHNSFVAVFVNLFAVGKKKLRGKGGASSGAAVRDRQKEHEAKRPPLSVCQRQGSERRCLAGCFCSPPRQITLDRWRENYLIDEQSYPLHVINTLLMAGHLSSILGPAQQKREGAGGGRGCWEGGDIL